MEGDPPRPPPPPPSFPAADPVRSSPPVRPASSFPTPVAATSTHVQLPPASASASASASTAGELLHGAPPSSSSYTGGFPRTPAVAHTNLRPWPPTSFSAAGALIHGAPPPSAAFSSSMAGALIDGTRPTPASFFTTAGATTQRHLSPPASSFTALGVPAVPRLPPTTINMNSGHDEVDPRAPALHASYQHYPHDHPQEVCQQAHPHPSSTHPPALDVFDFRVIRDRIWGRNWHGLEEYMREVLVHILDLGGIEDGQEVGQRAGLLYPNLFYYPRRQTVLNYLVEGNRFSARNVFDRFLQPLLQAEGTEMFRHEIEAIERQIHGQLPVDLDKDKWKDAQAVAVLLEIGQYLQREFPENCVGLDVFFEHAIQENVPAATDISSSSATDQRKTDFNVVFQPAIQENAPFHETQSMLPDLPSSSAAVSSTELFDVSRAVNLIGTGSWTKLVEYLEEFLRKIGATASEHPGLLIYPPKEKLLNFLEEGKVEKARQIFDDDLIPLLQETTQDYVPNNLRSDIESIGTAIDEISSGGNFDLDDIRESRDVRRSIEDYLRLHFPLSIGIADYHHGRRGLKSRLYQFARLNDDGSFNCLGCDKHFPAPSNITKLGYHLQGGYDRLQKKRKNVQLCPRMTPSVAKRVAQIKGSKKGKPPRPALPPLQAGLQFMQPPQAPQSSIQQGIPPRPALPPLQAGLQFMQPPQAPQSSIQQGTCVDSAALPPLQAGLQFMQPPQAPQSSIQQVPLQAVRQPFFSTSNNAYQSRVSRVTDPGSVVMNHTALKIDSIYAAAKRVLRSSGVPDDVSSQLNQILEDLRGVSDTLRSSAILVPEPQLGYSIDSEMLTTCGEAFCTSDTDLRQPPPPVVQMTGEAEARSESSDTITLSEDPMRYINDGPDQQDQ